SGTATNSPSSAHPTTTAHRSRARSFPREIVPGHHGKSVTCLRLDASSQAFTETEFFEKRNATTRNAFWCAPGRADGR
ncbi:MAG: hypothetical protein ACK58T_20245, partial [Phycisphaerae bacterium]